MQFNDQLTISQVVQCRSRTKYAASAFGIEIELESSRQDVPLMYGNPNTPAPWMYHEDQSLAPGGCEYVTNGAIALVNIPEKTKILLDFLGELTDQHKFDIILSRRTGLHYHSNVEHMTPIEYMKSVLAYLLLEPLMVSSQRYREDNLFCLPTWAAPNSIHSLIQDLNTGVAEVPFQGRTIASWLIREAQGNRRYRAINMAPVTRGSIEFRCFESSLEKDVLDGWPKLLFQAAKIGQSMEFRAFRDIVAKNEAIEWTIGKFGSNDLVKDAIPKAMKYWSNELLDLVFQLAISLHIYEDKLNSSNPADMIQAKAPTLKARQRRPWNPIEELDGNHRLRMPDVAPDFDFEPPRPDDEPPMDYGDMDDDELVALAEEGDDDAAGVLDQRRDWARRQARRDQPPPPPRLNPDPADPIVQAAVRFAEIEQAHRRAQANVNPNEDFVWNPLRGDFEHR